MDSLHKKRGWFLSLVVLLLMVMLAPNVNANTTDSNDAGDLDLEAIANSLPKDDSFIDSKNEQWFEEDYSMLFILPPKSTLTANGQNQSEWREIAQNFTEWKSLIGLRTLIVDNYTSYEGSDEPEKLRNCIKSYYNNYSVEWVLILGDPDYIPMRDVYNDDSIDLNRPESIGDSNVYKPTDFYYADLSGDWDLDNDGIWGEYKDTVTNSNSSETDYFAEVYVGRFPVKSKEQLTALVQKTIDYEQAKYAGEWMERFLAVSAISDFPYPDDLDGEDEAILNQYILDNYVDEKMNWLHLLEHTNQYDPPERIDEETGLSRLESLASGKMYHYLNAGSAIAVFAGHGSPSSFSTKTVGNALTSSDVAALENIGKTGFLFGDACSTNSYDYDSLGEQFVLNEKAGGIGYVGSLRISWYYPNDTALEKVNRGITKLFFKELFQNEHYQQGKTLYESKKTYVNSDWYQSDVSKNWVEVERKSLMSYMLLGDPSVDLYTAPPQEFTPFENLTSNLYAQSVRTIALKNSTGDPVKGAKLAIYSEDQDIYKTFKANQYGYVTIQFPNRSGQYNYTLFGHNMVYKKGQFSLLDDFKAPIFEGRPEMTPEDPNSSDNIQVFATLRDEDSGMGDSFVLLSEDGFQTFTHFKLIPNDGNVNRYSIELPKLSCETHALAIFAFDICNNFNSTLQSGEILYASIPDPAQKQAFTISNYVIMGLLGVAMGVAVPILSKKKSSSQPLWTDEDLLSTQSFLENENNLSMNQDQRNFANGDLHFERKN